MLTETIVRADRLGPTGNARQPTSEPPQLGSIVDAPLAPQAEHHAECRLRRLAPTDDEKARSPQARCDDSLALGNRAKAIFGPAS